MNAEILTVGTELLLGDILNSNSQFLSRELAAYGIQMLYQSTVGDNNARLKQVLSLALSRSDLVLITGGLGPTPDDLTRETVCEALDIPPLLHEESWQRIREYFENTGRDMSPSNKKQAMLPEGCTVFPNDHGTAPGCAVEKDGRVLILLPGPPRELIPMFNTYVAPYLSKFSGGTIFSRTVGVFGIPESTVAERLADLLSEANPTVAPYAKDGEVTLRVTARAADRESARALCDPVVEEIRGRLSVNVYGVDSGSLQKAVVSLLMDKQKKIATAESCTAGILSGRLTEVAGVSSVFECGIASYSNEIKHQVLGVPEELLEKYGAVSPEVACAMAVGARRVGQADLGVGITGVAGPDSSEGKPAGTVYIALADEKRTWVKKIVAGHSGGDREYVRFVATSHALDLVRRYLEALPAVMAGGELLAEPEVPVPVIPVAPKTSNSRRFLSRLLPWKGDTPFQLGVKIAVWVLTAALIIAGGLLFNHYVLEPANNQKLYNDLGDLYARDPGSSPPGTSAGNGYPAGMLSRFYGLYDRNPDVAGWIKIDDTAVNYPVMKDKRNGYYRNHNYDRRSSAYGVPYFDSTAALITPQSVNRTLTIYGNNTGNGQMFSDLIRYKSVEFLQTHALVEMNTVYNNNKWKIFGVMVVDENDASFTYTRTTFEDAADFLGFVSSLRERSLFQTPTTVDENDKLLFLSADAEDAWGFAGARMVVCARAVRDGESETANMTGTMENKDVLMPEAWQRLNTGPVTRPRRTAAATAKSTAPAGNGTTPEHPGDSTTDNDPVPGVGTTSGFATGKQTTATSGGTATSVTTTTTTAPSGGNEKPTPPPTLPIEVGPTLESEFLKDFVLQCLDREVKVETKEELQLALSYIVKREMGNAKAYLHNTEALKAQAVASYTHVLNYVADRNQPYPLEFTTTDFDKDNKDKRIYEAVGDVAGIKILQNNEPVCANYFTSSAGVTANNEYVYGAKLPYLKPVPSFYDTATYIVQTFGGNERDVSSSYSIELSDLLNKVKEYVKAKDTTVSNPDQDIKVDYDRDGETSVYAKEHDKSEYDPRGRYVSLTNVYYTINNSGKNYLTGHQLRDALGTKNLLSHSFRVSENGSTLTFQAAGHGHGVGMSQFGAMGYANIAGWNYAEILTHYYSITKSGNYQIVKPKWE